VQVITSDNELAIHFINKMESVRIP
jgi:hypothetical protein